MKRILLAATAALAFAAAQPAVAADAPVYKGPAPVAAMFNWSGMYIGINGGWAWGRGFFEFDPAGGIPGAFDVNGGLIGGTLGWNMQAPGSSLVWGLEGDLDWTNISGSGICPNPAFNCGVKNTWLGTLRGRVGMAANTLLLYVTGGAAFGSVNPFTTSPAFPGNSNTNVGWTVGAGVEAAVGGNLSVKAEYLYVDLGTASCTLGNCTGVGLGTATVRLTPSILRVGANWRW